MSGCEFGPGIIICYTRCEPCMYGAGEACFDPPQWHPWAGPDDIEHAAATGQDKPTGRCACECANAPQVQR